MPVTSEPALDLTDEVTLTAWFYFSGGLDGEPGIVQKDGPNSFGRYGLWVLDDQVDFCIYVDGGSQNCMYSDGTLTLDSWNHVAGVYDGSEMRLYLNGELDSDQPLSGAISTSDRSLYIGGDPTEPTYLAGRLHEVQVWSVARSEAQIASGMDDRPSGSEAGLVGYWPLNEGSGQTVSDASGNGLDGTLGSSGAADASDPDWETDDWPHS
ncbi:MAG: LamG domain-containing protein [Gemmatimonadota bacterium]